MVPVGSVQFCESKSLALVAVASTVPPVIGTYTHELCAKA